MREGFKFLLLFLMKGILNSFTISIVYSANSIQLKKTVLFVPLENLLK